MTSTVPQPAGVVVTRTPQAERTAATRLRLMEATIDCLVELGWTGTTTTIVSERAGVSRGAQLHHFPTKQDLVVSAVSYLMDRRRDELHVVLGDLPRGERVRAALELVSHQFTSPVFFAALELWVAARSDAELLKSVGPLERQVGRETHKHAIKILGIDEAKGNNRALIQATLDLLRGLGLAASLSDDSARRARILDAWADVLERELEMDA